MNQTWRRLSLCLFQSLFSGSSAYSLYQMTSISKYKRVKGLIWSLIRSHHSTLTLINLNICFVCFLSVCLLTFWMLNYWQAPVAPICSLPKISSVAVDVKICEKFTVKIQPTSLSFICVAIMCLWDQSIGCLYLPLDHRTKTKLRWQRVLIKNIFWTDRGLVWEITVPPSIHPVSYEHCSLLSYRGGDRKHSACYLLQSHWQSLSFPLLPLLFPLLTAGPFLALLHDRRGSCV